MNDKNIIITGANRGIGFNLLKHLLNNNHQGKIFTLGRKSEKIKKLVETIYSSNKYNVHFILMDLENSSLVKSSCEEILNYGCKVDIVISASEFLNTNREASARKVFSINFFNTSYFIQELLKNDIISWEAKIIFLSSLTGNIKIFNDSVIGKCIENATFDDLLHFSNTIIKEIDDRNRLFDIIKKNKTLPIYRLSKIFLNRYTELLSLHPEINIRKIKVFCIDPGLMKDENGKIILTYNNIDSLKIILDVIGSNFYSYLAQGKIIDPYLQIRNIWTSDLKIE